MSAYRCISPASRATCPLVRLLLEEGANHKLTTSKHYTALDVAQLFDQHAVSEVLRAHAAAVG